MNLKDYNKDIQKSVKSVIAFLKERYGKIDDSWETLLKQYADNLQLEEMMIKELYESGVYNREKGLKNPLISSIKDCQAMNLKIIQHLGISPYANGKLKVVDSDSADLLSTIIGEKDE